MFVSALEASWEVLVVLLIGSFVLLSYRCHHNGHGHSFSCAVSYLVVLPLLLRVDLGCYLLTAQHWILPHGAGTSAGNSRSKLCMRVRLETRF